MMPPASMLVIDDEDSICLAFRQFFEDRGWVVSVAASAEEGLSKWRRSRPTVTFLDVRLPDRSGLELLGEFADSRSEVIVITAYGGLDTVVRAIQGRAFDYLTKPLDLDVALALANRVRENRVTPTPGHFASQSVDEGTIIGNSAAMQDVYKLIARASESSSPVLIQGQTGTGKELVARAIHRFSSRSNAPFVALNCGAIPENLVESELFGHVRGAFTSAGADRTGRFEAADTGSLFLDEIGDLPLAVQVKLLRVLDTGVIERVGSSEAKSLNVRILAATNKDLKQRVQQGLFRQDLFYRLAVLGIFVPPLCERKDDILPLANHFLRLAVRNDSLPASLSASAVRVLTSHDWPGNVRELKNAIEHVAAIAPGRNILAEDLPDSVKRRDSGESLYEERLRITAVDYATNLSDESANRCHRTLEQVERALIVDALSRHRGNQTEAAEYLGLHRNTLRNKLRDLGIEQGDDIHERGRVAD